MLSPEFTTHTLPSAPTPTSTAAPGITLQTGLGSQNVQDPSSCVASGLKFSAVESVHPGKTATGGAT